jgi:hypothetical protein
LAYFPRLFSLDLRDNMLDCSLKELLQSLSNHLLPGLHRLYIKEAGPSKDFSRPKDYASQVFMYLPILEAVDGITNPTHTYLEAQGLPATSDMFSNASSLENDIVDEMVVNHLRSRPVSVFLSTF